MTDKQEPVGWMDSDWHYQLHKKGMVVMHKDGGDVLIGNPQPLYTTPQPRKPLTDEQIEQIENGIWRPEFFDDVEREANREFAKAIEAAHGIKE